MMTTIQRAQFEALSKKVEDRQDISEVQRRYYNTQYHYGYTNKYANTAQDKGRAYQSNPFAGDYQKVFSNEYTREMFRDHN